MGFVNVVAQSGGFPPVSVDPVPFPEQATTERNTTDRQTLGEYLIYESRVERIEEAQLFNHGRPWNGPGRSTTTTTEATDATERSTANEPRRATEGHGKVNCLPRMPREKPQ